jgi:Helix-turn-helix domain
MSRWSHSDLAAKRRTHALIFAALGDTTRLSLVVQLCRGEPRSISQLTERSRRTRQAITKHLRVLEGAGVELHLKGFLRTFDAGESAYTFCEPADEVLPAHHNGDTAGLLEKKLLGRHQPGCLMATAESRWHHSPP